MYITAVNDGETSVINSLMLKWDKLRDNAVYLSTEHRYKEKEYGISWRTAYKTFVETEFKKLVGRFGNPLNDGAHELEVIGALV